MGGFYHIFFVLEIPFSIYPNKVSVVGGGDNRAVTKLGFAHVTTETYAFLAFFFGGGGIFRFFSL